MLEFRWVPSSSRVRSRNTANASLTDRFLNLHLCRYRIASLDDLEFRKANSNKMKNLWTRLGFYARYGIFGGVCYYDA